MKGLDGVTRRGAELKALVKYSAPLEFNMAVAGWIAVVAETLSDNYPDAGLTAEWYAMSNPDLGLPTQQPSEYVRMTAGLQLDARLRWLANLPTKVQIRRLSTPEQVNENSLQAGRREVKLALTSRAIVDPARLEALQKISHEKFDLTKLIRLCQEMNLAFATESYLSMAMLTRAIIDHVPPIFGMKNFSEVANNYGGSSSLKKEFKHLETTARNIADLHLHSHIRRKEVLPNITQVDASNSLDLLLGEIISLLDPEKA